MKKISFGRIALVVFASLVAVLLILPTLAIIPIGFAGRASFTFPPDGYSLQWYENFFTDRAWMGSLQRSLWIGLLSAVTATVFGTLAAIGLSRWRNRKAASIVSAGFMIPMILPGIVLAVGVFATFSALGLTGSTLGFVIAHAALGMPYVLISVSAALRTMDPTVENAAVSLGASRLTVLRRIVLPLVMPGVLAGALLAFVTSFDEILVSLFIKSPFTETLPVRMYTSVVNDIDPTIAAASTIVLLFTTLVLLLGLWFGARMTKRTQRKVPGK